MSKTVYVVGGDPAVIGMFRDAEWAVAKTLDDFDLMSRQDLICFTGGADINPALYGETNQGSVGWNDQRDKFEKAVYDQFVGTIPMVGICRGGQLLNVLNGGKMIQDIGRYISGIAKAHHYFDDEYYPLYVDHHQGIIRNVNTSVSILAYDLKRPDLIPIGLTYACWYPETKCLCFQPHPEWGHEPTKNLFFNLLEEYIG